MDAHDKMCVIRRDGRTREVGEGHRQLARKVRVHVSTECGRQLALEVFLEHHKGHRARRECLHQAIRGLRGVEAFRGVGGVPLLTLIGRHNSTHQGMMPALDGAIFLLL